jgi:hypothetical protein
VNFQAAADGREGWNGRDHAVAGEEPGWNARGSATVSAPSRNGGNGRDARGRFAPGNQKQFEPQRHRGTEKKYRESGSGHGPRPDGPGANSRPEGDTTGHNTTVPPSAIGGNGRDGRGRFARGNPGGPDLDNCANSDLLTELLTQRGIRSRCSSFDIMSDSRQTGRSAATFRSTHSWRSARIGSTLAARRAGSTAASVVTTDAENGTPRTSHQGKANSE